MTNPDDRIKLVVEIWKKVVDVQQHFNDLCLRIRNFALTIFTFIIGAAGYLVKEEVYMYYGKYALPASIMVCIFGLPVIMVFWYMDRYWYHKLLLGAVQQGLLIENKHKTELEELGLTSAIGARSPNVWKIKSTTLLKIRSNRKVTILYATLVTSLVLLAGSLLFTTKKINKIELHQSYSTSRSDTTVSSSVTTNTIVNTKSFYTSDSARLDSIRKLKK